VSAAAVPAVLGDGGGGIRARVTAAGLDPHSPLNAALVQRRDRPPMTFVLVFVCTNPGCTGSKLGELASWTMQFFKPLGVEKGLIILVYYYITSGNSACALRISSAVSAQSC